MISRFANLSTHLSLLNPNTQHIEHSRLTGELEKVIIDINNNIHKFSKEQLVQLARARSEAKKALTLRDQDVEYSIGRACSVQLYFQGVPGIGKSELVKHIFGRVGELMSIRSQNDPRIRPYNPKIYVPTVNSKYNDGAKSTDCFMLIDDPIPVIDDRAEFFNDFASMVMNLNSTKAMAFNMSQADEKSTQFNHLRLVGYTSNISLKACAPKVTDYGALWRRFDQHTYHVVIDPSQYNKHIRKLIKKDFDPYVHLKIYRLTEAGSGGSVENAAPSTDHATLVSIDSIVEDIVELLTEKDLAYYESASRVMSEKKQKMNEVVLVEPPRSTVDVPVTTLPTPYSLRFPKSLVPQGWAEIAICATLFTLPVQTGLWNFVLSPFQSKRNEYYRLAKTCVAAMTALVVGLTAFYASAPSPSQVTVQNSYSRRALHENVRQAAHQAAQDKKLSERRLYPGLNKTEIYGSANARLIDAQGPNRSPSAQSGGILNCFKVIADNRVVLTIDGCQVAALAICGTILMVNAHVVPLLMSNATLITVSCKKYPSFTLDPTNIKVTMVENDETAFLRYESKQYLFKDITGQFINNTDFSHLSLSVARFDNDPSSYSCCYGNLLGSWLVEDEDLNGNRIDMMIRVAMYNGNGICMSMYADPHFDKLIGFHSAGCGGMSYFTVASRCDLICKLALCFPDCAEKYKDDLNSMSARPVPTVLATLPIASETVHHLDPQSNMVRLRLPKEANLQKVGETEFKPPIQMKSSIKPSAISEALQEFVPITTAPAELTNDGFAAALAKKPSCPPVEWIDDPDVASYLAYHRDSIIVRHRVPLALTFEQAIYGLSVGDFIVSTAFDKQTSLGPECEFATSTIRYLEHIVNDAVLLEQLRLRVYSAILQIRDGTYQPLYALQLKDECKPIEKAFRPRMFFAAQIVHKIVGKMLFAPVVSQINDQRYSTTTGSHHATSFVGFTEKDAKFLVRELLNFKHHLHELDVSACDLSHGPSAGEAFIRMAHNYTDSLSDSALPNYVLDFQDLKDLQANYVRATMRVTIVLGNNIFFFQTCLPSGDWITLVFNSEVLGLVVRVSAYKIYRAMTNRNISWNEFMTHVFRSAHFGDDVASASVIGRGDSITMPALAAQALTSFGYVLTDSKKSLVMPEFADKSSITFLKRTFTADKSDWRMPLNLDSIMQALHWNKNKNSLEEQLITIEGMVFELALHPKDVYDHYTAIIKKACTNTGIPINIPPYVSAYGKLSRVDRFLAGPVE